MRVLLSLSWGGNEATKIVTLPQGLSPFKGMTIHTACDIDFVVDDVNLSVDKLDLLDDPAIILILSDKADGRLDDHKRGEALFKHLCADLAGDGWNVPAEIS